MFPQIKLFGWRYFILGKRLTSLICRRNLFFMVKSWLGQRVALKFSFSALESGLNWISSLYMCCWIEIRKRKRFFVYLVYSLSKPLHRINTGLPEYGTHVCSLNHAWRENIVSIWMDFLELRTLIKYTTCADLIFAFYRVK